jgi:hypothetical protein
MTPAITAQNHYGFYDVEFRGEIFNVELRATYSWSAPLPSTREEPEDGGVELLAIHACLGPESDFKSIQFETSEEWVTKVAQDITEERLGQ